MGRGVVPLVQAGAGIIGTCCGSTPDHIREFRRALDAYLQTKDIDTRRPDIQPDRHAQPHVAPVDGADPDRRGPEG